MSDSKQALTEQRRSPERQELTDNVTVELPAELHIVGPGQNISPEGVFFIADATLPVKVRIDGREELIDGQIVRLESMGSGRIGVAVRFD